MIIILHGHYNYNEDFCGKGKEMVSFLIELAAIQLQRFYCKCNDKINNHTMKLYFTSSLSCWL